jgi:hypothetical protein
VLGVAYWTCTAKPIERSEGIRLQWTSVANTLAMSTLANKSTSAVEETNCLLRIRYSAGGCRLQEVGDRKVAWK